MDLLIIDIRNHTLGLVYVIWWYTMYLVYVSGDTLPNEYYSNVIILQ